MVADIGTLQRMPKLIGQQRALELAYTGRNLTGKEAEKYGLVLQCFETYDEMMAEVNAVASLIAEKSPLSVRYINFMFHTYASVLKTTMLISCRD